MLVSVELWETAAVVKDQQFVLCVSWYCQNVESTEKNLGMFFLKYTFMKYIYENLLAGGSLKAIFL